MKKDMMFIFFFIFALLALAVWNRGYLGLFGLVAKPAGHDNPTTPIPNRQRRTIQRTSTKRRESDLDSNYDYEYVYLHHTQRQY